MLVFRQKQKESSGTLNCYTPLKVHFPTRSSAWKFWFHRDASLLNGNCRNLNWNQLNNNIQKFFGIRQMAVGQTINTNKSGIMNRQHVNAEHFGTESKSPPSFYKYRAYRSANQNSNRTSCLSFTTSIRSGNMETIITYKQNITITFFNQVFPIADISKREDSVNKGNLFNLLGQHLAFKNNTLKVNPYTMTLWTSIRV